MAEEKTIASGDTGVVNDRSGTGRELAMLAVPLIISFVSQSIMGVVDIFIIGKVGTAEQGGVGLGMGLFWGFECTFAGLASVLTTFTAQSVGAGKIADVRRWLIAVLIAVLPFAVLLAFAAPLLGPILELAHTDASIRPHVITYLGMLLLCMPFFLGGFVFISFFRGIGDTVTPMVVAIVSNILNAFLGITFVFGLFGITPMGVRGVALATVISVIFSVVLFVIKYLSNGLHVKYETRARPIFSAADILRVMRVGFPIGASWLLENLAFNILTIYVATYDPESLAANTIVFQLISFSFLPAVAISIAASTLVGQYLGAGRRDLARNSARASIQFAVLFMGTVGFCFLTFRHPLIAFFNADPKVVELGGKALMLAAGFQVFDAMGITVDGIFRGAGYTLFPMLVRLVVMWAIFVPLIFILSGYTGSGVTGGWTAALIAIFLQGVIMFAAYRMVKWYDRKLVIGG